MSDTKNIDERCVLCLDPKRFPTSIKCGHSFCFGCLDIYKSYKKYPWANKCPICRAEIEVLKKPIKRKHSDQSSNVQMATINTSSTSFSSVATQRNSSLEDFMSLAVNYIDDSRDEGDFYFDSYDNMSLNNVEDLTVMSDENLATSYSQHDEEDMQFSAYSEDYNDTIDVDDDEHDHQADDYDYNDDYRHYDEDDEFSYDPARTGPDYDDYYSEDNDHYNDPEVISNINVDDYDGDGDGHEDELVSYGVDRFDIDWETVIASDVIIID